MLIDVLAENRDSLLMAEISAFIHDLGKLSREFIAYHSPLSKELFFMHQLILHRAERGHYGEVFVDDNTKEDETEIIQIPIDVVQGALTETRREYKQWKFHLTEYDRQTRLFLKDWLLHIVATRFSTSEAGKEGFKRLCESGFIEADFLPESLTERLNNFSVQLPAPLDEMNFYLGDLLERHHYHRSWYEERIQSRLPKDNTRTDISEAVLRFINCDQWDSGADKGKVAKLEIVQQSLDKAAISTVFGFESERIPVDELKDIRYRFCNILNRLCDCFASQHKKNKNLSQKEWYRLLYRQDNDSLGFRDEAHRAFSKALGEIRRGANDVTLWHHCFSDASLFKSLLAKMVIEQQFLVEHPDEKLKEELENGWGGKPSWRILRVNIDSLSLLSQAHKIGDILGLRQTIDEILDAVKRVVEVDYPLGNEVYRDESGIYFVFPNLEDSNEEYDIQKQVKEEISLKILAQKEVKEFDVEPLIALSEPSSFLTMIGEEIRKGYEEIANFSSANYPEWLKSWEECQKNSKSFLIQKKKESQWCTRLSCRRRDCFLHTEEEPRVYSIERCPVCGMRPKCVHQEVCTTCEKRKISRLNQWLEEPERTIWLSEIADHNGRAALITGVFGLKPWLNGDYVESMFTQSPVLDPDYKNYQEAQKEEWLPTEYYSKLSELEDLDFRGLVKEDDWRRNERDYRWKHSLFLSCCKHPSPARLRRVWDTTRQFLEKTVERTLKEYEYKDNGMRKKRMALSPSCIPTSPRESTLYVQGIRLDTYWDSKLKRFIVTENLDWLAEKFDVSTIEELASSSNWNHVEIRPPKERESSARTGEELSHNYPMEATLLTDKYREYRPYTLIHTSPLSFIAMVPAADATGILKAIKREYENQFSKVLNRLPLSLGSIFFPKRTPLYIALDGARKMMKRFRQPMEPETWTVVKAQPEQESNYVNLELKKNGKSFNLRVSCQLMEKEKLDFYHPHFFLVSPSEEHPTEERKSCFPTAGRWDYPLVHVTELFPDDKIEILPSYFDFEFIDSSEKRFLLNYAAEGDEDKRGYRRFSRTNVLVGKRPYYLHEMNLLEKVWELVAGERGLTQNQIKILYQTLAEKLKAWNLTWEEAAQNDVFKKFAATVLKTIDNGNFQKRLNKKEWTLMFRASQNGMLFDVLHLYQTVMKEKPKRD